MYFSFDAWIGSKFAPFFLACIRIGRDGARWLTGRVFRFCRAVIGSLRSWALCDEFLMMRGDRSWLAWCERGWIVQRSIMRAIPKCGRECWCANRRVYYSASVYLTHLVNCFFFFVTTKINDTRGRWQEICKCFLVNSKMPYTAWY